MPRKATGRKNGRPKKTTLSSPQIKALTIEVQKAGRVATDGISGSNLARICGVTRASVSKWRKDPVYQLFFSNLLGKKWSQVLEEKYSETIGEYYIDPDFKEPVVNSTGIALQAERKLRKEAYQFLFSDPEIYSLSIHEYVKKTWNAPFEDVGSGIHFKDSNQYFNFLTDNLLLPSDLLKQTMQRLQNSRKK